MDNFKIIQLSFYVNLILGGKAQLELSTLVGLFAVSLPFGNNHHLRFCITTVIWGTIRYI
ncbi:hypothetical protein TRIP_C60412 [Candidatus Zixiibacteriota bacterium]|nr:hypothetical protein TRIP_C60412 [candidate division Zixibacteria bacterium]